MKPGPLALLLLMNAFWAASYSSYRYVDSVLSPGDVVTLRTALAAGVLLLSWPWLPGQAPKGFDLLKTCLMGVVLFVIGQRLQVYGTQTGTAGNSSILMAVEPVLTSTAAAIFLRERLGPRRLTGFALGMIGVVLTSGLGFGAFEWHSLLASVVFVSSLFCEAAYAIIGKTMLARSGFMKVLAVSLFAATVVNAMVDGPHAIAAGRTSPFEVWLILGVLAMICTVVGYGLWFAVLRHSPVNVAALTLFTQAAFGVAVAALWLGEKVTLSQLAGSATIAAGLAIGLSQPANRT
jgi:O-acetylserine/cysteine efflux transporter